MLVIPTRRSEGRHLPLFRYYKFDCSLSIFLIPLLQMCNWVVFGVYASGCRTAETMWPCHLAPEGDSHEHAQSYRLLRAPVGGAASAFVSMRDCHCFGDFDCVGSTTRFRMLNADGTTFTLKRLTGESPKFQRVDPSGEMCDNGIQSGMVPPLELSLRVEIYCT
jgi:hypothetical protein